MARKVQAAARLVALDGTRHSELRKAARDLCERYASNRVKPGVSWWDASGLFFEVGLGKKKHRAASPRTVLLLYAADLAFRLRWQIRPALDAGQLVIAAPYIDTALAFGHACGLPHDWTTSLFAFAPKPDVRHVTRERAKSRGWKGNGRPGFAEFASTAVAASIRGFDPCEARRRMIAHLEAAAARR